MKGERKKRIVIFARGMLNQSCRQCHAAIPLANIPKEHQRSLDIAMDVRLLRWSKNFGEHHLSICVSLFMSLQYTARLHWRAVIFLLKPWQKLLVDLALRGHIHRLNSNPENLGDTSRTAANSELQATVFLLKR